ncbi:MAG: MotA/TolQ/ExbB proton channel family protein [Verrucomicrobiota bacterium]
MLSHILVEYFEKGGDIMWPMALLFFLAVCVIIDRVIWWVSLHSKVQLEKQEQAREDLGLGHFDEAWKICQNNADPYLHNLRDGMSHAGTSPLAAMQLHASNLLEKSESRLWVLSTVITLAPLLGLLGTVVGIMGSFNFIGNDQLAVTKVSGGIAEALIATAAGLGIAILCLLPFNFFRKKTSLLRGKLEHWINHCELLAGAAKTHGHDLADFKAPKS